MLLLVLMFAAPVNAADQNVNSDVWFVLVVAAIPVDSPSWTEGGIVLHNTANVTWNIMRSPVTAGTVQIGTAKSQTTIEFNNASNRGFAVEKFMLNFTDTNSTRNPYGVGTLEAVAAENLIALHTVFTRLSGNGTGTLIATQGTGDFANAMLTGDLVMNPLPAGPGIITEALFFGTHPRVKGIGRLEFNSLQGTYRDWKVMLYNSRVYLVPPANLTTVSSMINIGTWDSDYYGRIGKSVLDAAKPAIDECISGFR